MSHPVAAELLHWSEKSYPAFALSSIGIADFCGYMPLMDLID
jgi:hypothetical protein